MNAAASLAPASGESVRRNHDWVCRVEKSQLFRDYRSANHTATSLPLALRAAGSVQAPMAGSKVTTLFCALMMAGRTPRHSSSGHAA